MVDQRIIPILQIINGSLVKTTNFRSFKYIGDPINTARIFNELFVDEIAINDIRATVNGKSPDLEILKEIAQQCFIPLSYGGAIRNVKTAEKLYKLGFEKLIINTALFDAPKEIKEIVNRFGSQAVVASIDVKHDFFKRPRLYKRSGTKRVNLTIDEMLNHIETLGVGELIINDIDREGLGLGLNLALAEKFTKKTDLPVILHGGASSNKDIFHALTKSKLDAVGLGSMVIYQKLHKGVLVNYSSEFRDFLWQHSS